jgi:two-component system nitrate/nitrite response regulator NarL
VVVGEVADGAAARAAVSNLKPDLVLLDINLRDEGGYTVSRSLVDARRDLAVILISMDDKVRPEDVVAAGARCFITKEELVEANLAELVGRRV